MNALINYIFFKIHCPGAWIIKFCLLKKIKLQSAFWITLHSYVVLVKKKWILYLPWCIFCLSYLTLGCWSCNRKFSSVVCNIQYITVYMQLLRIFIFEIACLRGLFFLSNLYTWINRSELMLFFFSIFFIF